MSLWTLVYTSRATEHLSPQQLVDLMNECKTKNAEVEITGLLLHYHDNFIQVLEGERGAVSGLYRKIMVDNRHRYCKIVYEHEISERAFGNWTMGFKDLADIEPEQLTAYSDFLEQPYDFISALRAEDRVEFFLNLFRMRTR